MKSSLLTLSSLTFLLALTGCVEQHQPRTGSSPGHRPASSRAVAMQGDDSDNPSTRDIGIGEPSYKKDEAIEDDRGDVIVNYATASPIKKCGTWRIKDSPRCYAIGATKHRRTAADGVTIVVSAPDKTDEEETIDIRSQYRTKVLVTIQ